MDSDKSLLEQDNTSMPEHRPASSEVQELLESTPRHELAMKLGDLTGPATESFQRRYPTYGDIDLIHTSTSMARSFAGPVMNGPARTQSENYQLETEVTDTEFKLKIKDTSINMSSEPGSLSIDTEGEYRQLIFKYQDGDSRLFNLWMDEVYNELSGELENYGREEEFRIFTLERNDVQNI